MPAYNAAEFIEPAIQSVLAQTLNDWELIIVDDGSTDRTAAILSKLSDPRIKVLRQSNAGVGAARNAGLDAAVGEFVTFLDADDKLPPASLQRRVEFLIANPGVDIVNGRINIMTEGRTTETYRPSLSAGALFPRIARLEEGVFFGPFYKVRRAVIGTRRFPVGISHCEDLIFFLELAHDANLTYAAVDDDVYRYRRHAGSAMSNLAGIEAGYLELLRRASNLIHMDPAMMRHLRFRIASILLKSWLRRLHPLRAVTSYLLAIRA